MINRKPGNFSLLFIPLILFLFLSSSPFSRANAANPIDKLSEIQNKLKTRLIEATEARKKEKSLREKMDSINKNITKKEKELAYYNKNISKTESQILALSKEINALNEKINSRKQYLKERIMAIYKRQYGGKALILISAKNYQDLQRKSNYLSLMAHYDKTVLDEYSTHAQDINLKKEKLTALQGTFVKGKNNVQKKMKEVESDRTIKNKLLETAKARRNIYEKSIRELENSSHKLQSVIKENKAKKIPQAILGKGFTSLKGSLPWPVDGKISVPYGKHTDPDYNVTYFKKGIELDAPTGDNPRAVAGGRVVYAGDFQSYGKIIIVDHGSGYHSLYGNLADFTLKTGELLTKGMEIGKADNSKLNNTPTLYYELRFKGKPINPMDWLEKR